LAQATAGEIPPDSEFFIYDDNAKNKIKRAFCVSTAPL